MRALLDVILLALQLYTWVIIAVAVLSWLLAFNVINYHNNLVRSVWTGLNAITEPLLRPIRRILPQMGGLDISPIILLLIIFFIERIIQYNLYPLALGM
jgi:YggT family protein